MTRPGLEPGTYGLKDHIEGEEVGEEKRGVTGIHSNAAGASSGEKRRHDGSRRTGSRTGRTGSKRASRSGSGRSLGNNTNRVSLGNNTNRVSLATKRTPRDVAFDLRDGLRGYSASRVAKCGRVRISENVEVALRGGRAHFHGVMRCGSVWECAVCSMAIRAERAEEMRRLVAWHGQEGAHLLTLTIPHGLREQLRAARQTVSLAFRRMLSGAPWKRMGERYGLIGIVRALEVTHGAHGWHPHIHAVLLLRKLTQVECDTLKSWIARRWRDCVARVTDDAKAPTLENGCDLRRCRKADYLAKLGMELAAPVGKRARRSNRSPLAIAQDFLSHGDEEDLILWQAYASGMRGARMLTWSVGVRAAAGLSATERTDQEIVAGEDAEETLVAAVAGADWDSVRDKAGAKLALLHAAERGGAQALLCALSTLLGRMPSPPTQQTSSPVSGVG